MDAVQICPERLPYKKTSKKLISEMQGLENAIQAANRRYVDVCCPRDNADVGL